MSTKRPADADASTERDADHDDLKGGEAKRQCTDDTDLFSMRHYAQCCMDTGGVVDCYACGKEIEFGLGKPLCLEMCDQCLRPACRSCINEESTEAVLVEFTRYVRLASLDDRKALRKILRGNDPDAHRPLVLGPTPPSTVGSAAPTALAVAVASDEPNTQ